MSICFYKGAFVWVHYNDVIVSTMAFQIIGVSIVCSTVGPGADQRKHQSSASLAFVGEFTGDLWIPRTKGQQRGRCFHLMTSSWCVLGAQHMSRVYTLAVVYPNSMSTVMLYFCFVWVRELFLRASLDATMPVWKPWRIWGVFIVTEPQQNTKIARLNSCQTLCLTTLFELHVDSVDL